MNPQQRTIKARVYGLVQGVWFRDSTRRWAQSAGVTGYANNLPDGSVEVMASGTPAAIEAFIGWLHQGPPKARVERVVVETVADQVFEAFTVG